MKQDNLLNFEQFQLEYAGDFNGDTELANAMFDNYIKDAFEDSLNGTFDAE